MIGLPCDASLPPALLAFVLRVNRGNSGSRGKSNIAISRRNSMPVQRGNNGTYSILESAIERLRGGNREFRPTDGLPNCQAAQARGENDRDNFGDFCGMNGRARTREPRLFHFVRERK